MTDIRPIPGDPGEPIVQSILDVGEDWLITKEGGDYESFAVETMRRDGTNWQRAIAIRWNGRYNKTTEAGTAQVLMSPEDAVALAESLAHTAGWLLELAKGEGA